MLRDLKMQIWDSYETHLTNANAAVTVYGSHGLVGNGAKIASVPLPVWDGVKGTISLSPPLSPYIFPLLPPLPFSTSLSPPHLSLSLPLLVSLSPCL